MKIMSIISIILSTLIMKTINPMIFTILILLQTLVLCIILCFLIKTSWFSYILFLIFLGGLMIIFSYICSLASNESISAETDWIFILFLCLMSVMLMSAPIEIENFLNNESLSSFFKMMSKFIMTPTVISMIYLLLTLIVIAKISFKKMGSLRSYKK